MDNNQTSTSIEPCACPNAAMNDTSTFFLLDNMNNTAIYCSLGFFIGALISVVITWSLQLLFVDFFTYYCCTPLHG